MKQAMLILSEAGDKTSNAIKGVVDKTLSTRFPDIIFKSFSYEADHPEEVTYHLGQWVKFLARTNGNEPEPEQFTEEELTFRQQVRQFWEAAKPSLKQLGKEIWYSKAQLREMEEGKKTTERISTGTVKFDKSKEAPA